MRNLEIKNNRRQNISLDFYEGEKNKPLIIFVHGFRGKKSQRLISATAELLTNKGFLAITFDAANHVGESDGNIFDFTLTGFIDDLDCVINYVLENNLSQKIILAGHSLGGTIILYSKYLEKITSLLFLSAALFHRKGGLFNHPDYLSHDNQKIYFKHKDIAYETSINLETDYEKYDEEKMFNVLEEYTKPKLFLYFENDEAISQESFLNAFEKSSEPKKYAVIPNAPHNPNEDSQIENIADEIINFLM